jgi:xanthine dehydrogenase small subunit
MQSLIIKFYINGSLCTFPVMPDQTALDLIRNGLGLTGTKEGCSEGDCGACTVALGTLHKGRIRYQAVTSCILPAAKLHGRHVITIEGLAQAEKLHPLQQAILENRATQCGFCTPGVIMSLFCLFSGNQNPSTEEINASLEGNLCRCTGYRSIRQAAFQVADSLNNRLISVGKDVLPGYETRVRRGLTAIKTGPEVLKSGEEEEKRTKTYHSPKSLPQLFSLLKRFKSCRQYRLISGGTDVMVDRNIKRIFPEHLVDISGIAALNGIKQVGRTLYIGANVTLSQIIESLVIGRRLPVLAEAASQMASAQVRNVATLAGNLANASPIADGGVLMLALGAKLRLASPRGVRTVPIDEFYKSYRRTCLADREVIVRLEVPLDGSFHIFLKSAKRRAVDISSVNSAVKISFSKGKVKEARIALGGVAPTPVLARKTAESLAGKKLTEEVMEKAAEMAVAECSPFSDVRGGAMYRRTLVRNHVVRHLGLFTSSESWAKPKPSTPSLEGRGRG